MVERAQHVDFTSHGVCLRLLRSRSAGITGSSKLLGVPLHGHPSTGSVCVVADGHVDPAVSALPNDIVVAA